MKSASTNLLIPHGTNAQKARVILLGLAMTLIGGVWMASLSGQGFVVSSNEPEPVSDHQSLFSSKGSDLNSCADCHGSHAFIDTKDQTELWQSAYQIWSSRDPHSQASLTLFNQQSKQIVARLLLAAHGQNAVERIALDDQAIYTTVLKQQCLSCHSTDFAGMPTEMIKASAGGGRDNDFSLTHGVSCHSCHSVNRVADPTGNSPVALPWVELHTKQSWADGLHNRSQAGLQDLSNHNVRARVCAACHLGSENREVNHDLIAAGHPRLVFEYSSLLSRLPSHWNETPSSNFNVECWSIGQVESARSSLALLASRARSSRADRRPWPEFAEYNCHNCHHALAGNWYVPSDEKRFGNPVWGSWSFSYGAAALTQSDSWMSLQTEMRQPLPNAKSVSDLADAASAFAPALDAAAHWKECLIRQPELNSDELFAWYLAVASCLRDANTADDESAELQRLMLEFKSILDIPFGRIAATGPVEPEKLQKLMAEIRRSALKMLEKRRDVEEPRP